jgi:hypothetical protein
VEVLSKTFAWNAWPEASTVFRKLSQYPPVLGKDDQSILEKFVVIMYDISTEH